MFLIRKKVIVCFFKSPKNRLESAVFSEQENDQVWMMVFWWAPFADVFSVDPLNKSISAQRKLVKTKC